VKIYGIFILLSKAMPLAFRHLFLGLLGMNFGIKKKILNFFLHLLKPNTTRYSYMRPKIFYNSFNILVLELAISEHFW